MIIDPELTEKLSQFGAVEFSDKVFRATPKSIIDPLAPSRNGGRWMPREVCPVLYTSCEREGALAEISFHFAQHKPLPSKPICLHRIDVATQKTLHLIVVDLEQLGVKMSNYNAVNYRCTQQIGSAVQFLGCDGLIVPSARWDCENLVIFSDNHPLENDLKLVDSEEIDWKSWARVNKFID